MTTPNSIVIELIGNIFPIAIISIHAASPICSNVPLDNRSATMNYFFYYFLQSAAVVSYKLSTFSDVHSSHIFNNMIIQIVNISQTLQGTGFFTL